MNRLVWTCALLIALVIAFSAAAFAQYEGDEGTKLSAFAGIYSPSGSTLRDGGDSLWKCFGVGYSLKTDLAGRPTLYVSAEFKTSEGDHFSGSCTSLTAVKLFRSKPKSDEDTGGFYYGAGISANLLKETVDGDQFQMPPIEGEDNSGTKFGFTVVGGYDFGSSFYAEARYSQMSELAPNADFSGLTFYVGTRSLF